MFLQLLPQAFLLRYTVIIGIIFAIVGLAIIFMSKRLSMVIRKAETFDKTDKLYQGILITGIVFVLIGMICIALPFDGTFYKG